MKAGDGGVGRLCGGKCFPAAPTIGTVLDDCRHRQRLVEACETSKDRQHAQQGSCCRQYSSRLGQPTLERNLTVGGDGDDAKGADDLSKVQDNGVSSGRAALCISSATPGVPPLSGPGWRRRPVRDTPPDGRSKQCGTPAAHQRPAQAQQGAVSTVAGQTAALHS